MKITRINAREIFDSRGIPTIQCEIVLDDANIAVSSVPSGLSKSKYEARELRDGGLRLGGYGVTKAIENIENRIAPLLVGREPKAIEMDLELIELDGTVDKSSLGANAILAVSMGLYRAQAILEGMEIYELIASLLGNDTVSLPFPWLNIINGGMHASNDLAFQEFLIIPVGAQSFRKGFESAVLIFHALAQILEKSKKNRCVGDEGGFAPILRSNEEALDLIMQATESVSAEISGSCVIALDVAASHFYDRKSKLYHVGKKYLETEELIEYYKKLTNSYPIYAIEDGLDQDDWEGWKQLFRVFEQKIQVIGDDLTSTNVERLAYAIERKAISGTIIKPNQVGTVTEALQAIQLSKENGINTVISHRSGETDDNFIADLTVGSSAGQIKAGSCSRGERLAKYNRLLNIEDELTLNMLS